MELGGLWWTNVLNMALPPQRHRPDTRPQHQDPVIHMAQNKREKKRKKEKIIPDLNVVTLEKYLALSRHAQARIT